MGICESILSSLINNVGIGTDCEKQVYNMFHRQYMHAMLMESAVSEEGEGTPAKLILNHRVR